VPASGGTAGLAASVDVVSGPAGFCPLQAGVAKRVNASRPAVVAGIRLRSLLRVSMVYLHWNTRNGGQNQLKGRIADLVKESQNEHAVGECAGNPVWFGRSGCNLKSAICNFRGRHVGA
jgi:hypothetical protein